MRGTPIFKKRRNFINYQITNLNFMSTHQFNNQTSNTNLSFGSGLKSFKPCLFETPKRSHEEIDEDTVKFQKIRKVTVLQANSDEDNESTLNPFAKFRTPTQPNDLQSTAQKPKIKDKIGFSSASASLSLREKYSNLLPDHLKAKLSRAHVQLSEIAGKIDNYLVYQKAFREMKNGDTFTNIKKNLNTNYHLMVDMAHIRKIVHIMPEWFDIKKQADDYRITLAKCKQDSESRKVLFRKKIYELVKIQQQQFKLSNGAHTIGSEGWAEGFNYDISIPEATVEVAGAQKKKATVRSNSMPKLIQTKINLNKLNPKQILSQRKSGEQSFQDRLYRMIADKEQKLNQINQECQRECIDLVKQDILKIVEETNLLYIQKNVSNMFYVNLLELLVKRTGYSQRQIEDCLEDVQNKGAYMKTVKHTKGKIIQIDRSQYESLVEKIDKEFL